MYVTNTLYTFDIVDNHLFGKSYDANKLLLYRKISHSHRWHHEHNGVAGCFVGERLRFNDYNGTGCYMRLFVFVMIIAKCQHHDAHALNTHSNALVHTHTQRHNIIIATVWLVCTCSQLQWAHTIVHTFSCVAYRRHKGTTTNDWQRTPSRVVSTVNSVFAEWMCHIKSEIHVDDRFISSPFRDW